jgi:hypothetical protein
MVNQLSKIASYNCSQCEEKYTIDEMIEFENLLICSAIRKIK